MESFLSIFDNNLPIYICPWCNSVGQYDKKDEIRSYYKEFYLMARCLKCKDNEEKCDCYVHYPKTLCKKHRDTFQIKIKLLHDDQYSIMDPNNELLMEKQSKNIIRLSKFMCDANHTKKLNYIERPGTVYQQNIPISDFIKDQISKIIKNVLSKVKMINHIFAEYQCPQELKIIVLKLILNEELFGIITI